MDDDWMSPATDDETYFAQERHPERTYASKSFPVNPPSRDAGQPARFVYKVFDTDDVHDAVLDGEIYVVNALNRKQRFQLKVLIARDAGRIKDLWIYRVSQRGAPEHAKQVLNLQRDDARRLIELLRRIDAVPINADVESVRIDDALLQEIFADPTSMAAAYREDPTRFRTVISSDETARDLIATAHRRAQLKRFKRLLNDDRYFDAEIVNNRPEGVWQRFFEENPWILGVALGSQLLTGWDNARLEQVVAGASILGVGKRADALLRTTGRVRSMVFAEIKHHRTALLERKEYRSGCWAPSSELAGGVVQAQGTVHRAVTAIGERLADQATDGSDLPGAFTYLLRPRSYLIAGQLTELLGVHDGDHQDKIRSFELFRRHLDEPEVITFDELLARAEWLVQRGHEEGAPDKT